MLTLTLTHFLAKTIFSRGYGGYIKLVKIPEGWGGGELLLCSKNRNSREEGGTCMNSLSGGGMDIFWNYAIN